jgi:membrane dipeptidase
MAIRNVLVLSASALAVILLSCTPADRPLSEEELRAKARSLARDFLIVDTHIDVPYRLMERMEDISVRTARGDFDYPRALEGGLDAPFMSIYVPSSYEEKGGAKALADSLIDMVRGFWEEWPDKFAPAVSPADVTRNAAEGRISLPMGMENGAPVEGKLENLKYFHDRGIRYITLAHSRNNHICDSSYDKKRTWNGLSPFGREVVAEMNRLGLMVDVSHVSDSTFYQVIALSRAPVIASHSSCRAFTPDWERNMSDEMIRALARNGGVIQINFGSSFLDGELRKKWNTAWDELERMLEEHKLGWSDEAAEPIIKEYREQHGIDYADISHVVAHIDHVVKLVGTDHVGLGSDFDGVGDSLPTGLKDVSMYPNLIFELLRKNYSEEDVRKICGGNILRVWTEVEQIARTMQEAGT